MHNFSVVRSVNHRVGAHNSATYYSLTGHTPQVDIVSATASASDFPAYGSVVSKIAPSQARVPTFVALPWMIADGVFRTPGQFAGYLGKEHDPLFITKDPNSPSFSVEELTLPIEVPLERVSSRRALPLGLAAYAQLNESIAAVRGLDSYQQKALSLLTSSETQRAFDILAEGPRLRDRYGRTPYGQSVLMARRLVEAGVRFVTVFYSPGINGWDTHKDNFSTLRDKLLPTTDQTLPTLIEDLGVARPARRDAGRLGGRDGSLSEDEQDCRTRALAAVLYRTHGRRRPEARVRLRGLGHHGGLPQGQSLLARRHLGHHVLLHGDRPGHRIAKPYQPADPRVPRHAHHAAAGLKPFSPAGSRGRLRRLSVSRRAPSGAAALPRRSSSCRRAGRPGPHWLEPRRGPRRRTPRARG